MLSLIFKDKGTSYHNKITESNYWASKKELDRFEKYFRNREKIGSRFFYTWGGDWTKIFSFGFQLFRLPLGPIGIIAEKIPFVALLFFIAWVHAAILDWVFLLLPYFIFIQLSKLPRDDDDSDLLIGPYVYGNIPELKNDLRKLVVNDRPRELVINLHCGQYSCARSY